MSRRSLLRALGGLAVLAFLLAGFTPLPNLWLRLSTPPAELVPADAIVVLGAGSDREGTLADSSLRRLVEGVRLERAGLAPLLVLSGPAYHATGPTEAEARARLALAFGVPPDRLLRLEDARTTRAEAARCRELLGGRVRSVLLVTSRPHMVRAAALFRRAGFAVHPAPVDDRSPHTASPEGRLALTRALLQELAGRLYYRAFGYL